MRTREPAAARRTATCPCAERPLERRHEAALAAGTRRRSRGDLGPRVRGIVVAGRTLNALRSLVGDQWQPAAHTGGRAVTQLGDQSVVLEWRPCTGSTADPRCAAVRTLSPVGVTPKLTNATAPRERAPRVFDSSTVNPRGSNALQPGRHRIAPPASATPPRYELAAARKPRFNSLAWRSPRSRNSAPAMNNRGIFTRKHCAGQQQAAATREC